VQKYAFSARNGKIFCFLCFFLKKVIVICKLFAIFANWKLQTANDYGE